MSDEVTSILDAPSTSGFDPGGLINDERGRMHSPSQWYRAVLTTEDLKIVLAPSGPDDGWTMKIAAIEEAEAFVNAHPNKTFETYIERQEIKVMRSPIGPWREG